MATITKSSVDQLTRPGTGQKFLRDDKLRGFALRVTASGAKSFVYEGRIHGRVRRITIGPYPALNVAVARQAALRLKAAVAQGRDPAQEKIAERNVVTFGDLAEVYIEDAKAHKRTWSGDLRMIEGYFAKWRGTPLKEIATDEVFRLHQRLGKENGRYAANRAVALLRTMFNLARDWGHLDGTNPAARVKFYHEEKRDRFLSPEELRRVNAALVDEPNPHWRAYFPLSLMLGTRRGELLSARWDDLDFERRQWRIPTTKAGRPHLLPLPNAAVEILKALPRSSEYVFPGTGTSGHLTEVAKVWQRIRKRAGVPDARIHDLRRTLGSWLAAQGHSLPLIGRALNHTNASATQVYARLDLEPVRDALEKNAALMFGPTADGGGLVSPIPPLPVTKSARQELGPRNSRA
jgi:integrase